MKIAFTIVLNVLITATIILTLTHISRGAYPTSPLYNLQRLEENVIYTLQRTPEEKAAFQLDLLDKRLGEIKRVFAERKYQDLLATSLRYTATAGKATEIITTNSLPVQREQLQSKLLSHEDTFIKLREETSSTVVELSYIQDNLNYMKAYQQQLKN